MPDSSNDLYRKNWDSAFTSSKQKREDHDIGTVPSTAQPDGNPDPPESRFLKKLSRRKPSKPQSEKEGDHTLQRVGILVQVGLLIATSLAFYEARRYADIAANQRDTMDRAFETGFLQTKATQSANLISKNSAEENIAAISKQMRQDQRPWLRVEFAPTPGASNDPTQPKTTTDFSTDKPASIPIRIRNSGKTPAMNIVSEFIVELAGINERMAFPAQSNAEKRIYSRAYRPSAPDGLPDSEDVLGNHMETGIIFPDSFTPTTVVRAQMKNGKPDLMPFSIPEALDIIKGIRMVYIVGRIEYADEFGISHWTDFCRALSDAPENFRCAKFNAADGN